jgi:3',5'-cyclic AMP phosphodiesterase CpdA
MANKYIKKIYLFITGLLIMHGCYKDLDFTGFIRSTDRVNERFTESLHWNNNNPHPEIELDTNNYSIMLAADCHVGTTNNLDKLLGLSKAPEISALFIAGDITTGKKEDYDVVRQKLNNSDSVSCFLIAGNHDLYFDGWKTFFSYFGSSTYTILIETQQGTDLYICLDTGGGTLGDRQLEWLMEILSNDREKYRHCVVITHNNFFRNRFTTSTNPLVEELYVLLELFTRYQVNFVITGHDHKRHIEVFGPTTYITLDALKDGLVYASSLKLTVYNDSIIYQFIDM